MNTKVIIPAGTPDDDNRDYLPESLKGSDIVVNENGNNSRPYPKLLKEYNGVILKNGEEDTWYEYVPESYDPSKKIPLVVSLHGGLMTGWGQAVYTSWTMMADRDNFIVLFPNAHSDKVWSITWTNWEHHPKKEDMQGPAPINDAPKTPEENLDNQLLLGLIDLMKSKYNIDESRIYMQGMSMGNLMTAQFSRNFGEILAGAGGSGAATFLPVLFEEDGKIINRAGHVPFWQTRPELNNIPERKELALKVHKYNRLYWMKLNECEDLPQISIQGEHNLAFYKGKKGGMVYLDIKNRDHGQSLDDAALVWDYFFSGLRRESDGSITVTDSYLPKKGDEFAISVADGCKMAWVNNKPVEMSAPATKWQKLKYHGLDGAQKVRGEYICVPLSFIAKVFDEELEVSEDALSAELHLKDGRNLQFARGSIGCVIDNTVRCMYCEALHRSGELYVPFDWFAKAVYNLHVSECDDVLYATDHFSELSLNMADLIRDILKGEAVPEDFGDVSK